MSRARGVFARSDLMYREIDKRLDVDPEEVLQAEDAWLTLDAVTRKVIQRLHDSDISEWDSEIWRTFQKLLNLRPKTGIQSVAPELRDLSVEELKSLTKPTSSDDP